MHRVFFGVRILGNCTLQTALTGGEVSGTFRVSLRLRAF